MLDQINRLLHGFTAIPVIMALKKKLLFTYFEQNKTFKIGALCKEFSLNKGIVQIALELLCSLGWLNKEGISYSITRDLYLYKQIPGKVDDLLHFPFDDYLSNNGDTRLAGWITMIKERWGCNCSDIAELLDGMVLVPLLIKVSAILKEELENNKKLFSTLPGRCVQEVTPLFLHKGWLREENGVFLMTDEGSFFIDRIMICASVYSYKPMFSVMDTLLSGNYQDVFALDEQGNEAHIDRNLNVIGSGFQHEKYFHDLESSLLHIFNNPDIAGQPGYIVDCGCGDGSLLLRVYNAIVKKSVRGEQLTEYPLIMIGVDYHRRALEETGKTLAGLPHILIQGDIGKPGSFIKELEQKYRVQIDDMLHIRSFLDHNRPFNPPADKEALADKKRFDYSGVYVNNRGKMLDAYKVVQSTVEHLKKWAKITKCFGLMLLEVHSIPFSIKRQYPDASESIHFDTYHSLSGQYLLEAPVFLLCAAEAGLFPDYKAFKYYPRVFPFRRITMGYFQKKPFTIRWASLKDLPQLEQLEVSWQNQLRCSKRELEKRLTLFPEGQFVMESGGKIIGAVYTQLIRNPDQLWTTTFKNIQSLHDKEGKVMQLLGLSILPEFQNRGYADEIIEFIIHYAKLHNQIASLVGVSRCKNYCAAGSISIEEYIKQRSDSGRLVDPILDFHESHGARIGEILYHYRPEDTDNEGQGVLLSYSLDAADDIAVNNLYIKEEKKFSGGISRDEIKSCLLSILGKEREKNYSESTPFKEMGLDSLEHLEFRALLENKLNRSFNSSLLFQYSTVDTLAAYFREKGGSQINVTQSETATKPDTKDAAVIGMAFSFAGANTKEEFWNILEKGESLVRDLPEIRRTEGWKKAIDLEPALAKGAFLDRIDYFDNSFFNISPLEAQYLDPQQRMLLEKSWEAFEDAGYSPGSFSGTKTGVFIGACNNDYRELVQKRLDDNEALLSTGTFSSLLANRLSYFYDFKGPSIQIDTACSSSLVAVHEAVQAVVKGECSMALAGGVNLICTETNSRSFFEARMLSPEGTCYTFDARAKGYVRGEGAGLILLKPLDEAVRDKDHIYGVIKGSSVNHGGKSNSLTAPNPGSQSRLLQQAYKDAGIAIDTVSFIEAHGTGTALGDPIEIEGLKQAFNLEVPRPFCGLSSVKPLIGHLEAAAGIAGLIRVLLSMECKKVTKTGLFETLNPEIDIDRTPFYIVTENSEWKQLQDKEGAFLPRRSGVSSFGFGGTNAHVVVEEFSSENREGKEEDKENLFIFSAKSTFQLERQVKSMAEFLASEWSEGILLNHIAYTLQTGRETFGEKYAVTAKSKEELVCKLQAFCDGDRSIKVDRTFSGVLQTWLDGEEVNWDDLYIRSAPGKVSLPAYPFQRKSFWIENLEHIENGSNRKFYTLEWEKMAQIYQEPGEDDNNTAYVVIKDRSGYADSYIKRLDIKNREYYIFESPQDSDKVYSQLMLFFENVIENCTRALKVLNFSPLDAESGKEISTAQLESEHNQYCTITLSLVQILTLYDSVVDAKLYLITKKALHSTDSGLYFPTGSTLWGLGAVVDLEMPHIWGGCIDIDETILDNPGPLYELITGSSESRISLKDGISYCRRLKQNPAGKEGKEPAIDNQGSYLVISRTGAVCFETVKWLASEGAGCIFIAGTRGLSGEIETMIRDVETAGVVVEYIQWDITDESGIETVKKIISGKKLPLKGIFNSDSFMGGTLLNDYQPEQLVKDILAKAGGIWNLHSLSQSVVLDFFVLDSSFASYAGLIEGASCAASAGFDNKPESKGFTLDFYHVPPDKRLEACIDYIREITAGKMGFEEAAQLDIDFPLRELGMDSITGVKVVNKLKIDTGLDVAVTDLYNYPTIRKLAEYLVADVLNGSGNDEKIATKKTAEISRSAAEKEQIAVVGIGCDFPGGVVNSRAFWEMLEKGVDGISEIPRDRWDLSRFYHKDPGIDGKCYTKWGGFIDDADSFDPAFFGISPVEAQEVDPQQRILIKVAWEALENAGIDIKSLESSDTGVFIGINSVDYVENSLFSGRLEDINLYSLTGTTHSSAAGRLSYLFDFKGPSVAIDTACSSSLVAVHYGIQSLLNRESHMCLVGGVNILSSPNSFIGMSKLRALSPEGRCKAFDDAADGFVRSEGCGILVLKRLSDAIANGDTVYALLKGSAVNHDGRSIGFTAPNGLSQEKVIKKALENARISSDQVDYVEAHGTGTKQGDPIEVAALGSVFKNRKGPLLVGSVKTNIGHLEAASGIAGLIKVILALKHKKIPGNLHYSTPNSHIDWHNTPVKVVDSLTPFEKRGQQPRIAGVSSFGMTGTNAHVIVEEAPFQDEQNIEDQQSFHILAFSAKRDDDLLEMAESYKHYLETSRERLENICFTSNTSRTFFNNRAAFIGKNRQEIIDQLEQFINGKNSKSALLSLLTKHRDIKSEKEIALIQSYLSGDDVDWEKLYDR